MSKEIVVFTKRPEDGVCPACKMLKRKLDAEGIPYKEIPYNPENVEDVEGAFSGFAPKKVAELKARFK